MSRRITPTYILLNQITLAANATSVTFSNIPQNYGDLVLMVSGTSTTTQTLLTRFNSDSGSNYSYVLAFANGSTVLSLSGGATSITQIYLTPTETVNTVQLMDYSAVDKHKTALIGYRSANVSLQMSAERWANTSAINTISLTIASGNINSGSSFSLYGIAA